MTEIPKLLHISVIGVLVAYVEGSADRTAVGILPVVGEQFWNIFS